MPTFLSHCCVCNHGDWDLLFWPVVIAAALLESYSQCFYGNTHNKGHDGPFILGGSPNSIKGGDDKVRDMDVKV